MSKTAVVCFQKANPPTKVHGQFFRMLIELSRQREGKPIVFLSPKYDATQNPIPWSLRVSYIQGLFKKLLHVNTQEDISSISDALSYLIRKNYTKIVVLAGLDEEEKYTNAIKLFKKEMLPLLKDENKVFEEEEEKPDWQPTKKIPKENTDETSEEEIEITLVSTEGKDPDNENTHLKYSSAQIRNAVLDDDMERFKYLALGATEDDYKKLFSMVKTGMGLSERAIFKRKALWS